MLCPNCGASNAEGSRFCVNCGTVFASSYDNSNAAPNQQPSKLGKIFSIISMALGITGAVIFCYGIIFGIPAIILAAISKSKGYSDGMTATGLICGIVAVALFFTYWIGLVACGACSDIYYYL